MLVAVMVADPTAMPLTRPVALTLALVASELDQVTSWLAPTGVTTASRSMVAPTATLAVAGVTSTAAMTIGAGSRVMVGGKRRAV
ncbi:hypothetical protein D3C79_870740 [compost metagenome]